MKVFSLLLFFLEICLKAKKWRKLERSDAEDVDDDVVPKRFFFRGDYGQNLMYKGHMKIYIDNYLIFFREEVELAWA